MKTPSDIKGIALFGGIPKTKAQIEPVQAPVNGKGIASKITKPNSLNFWNKSW